MKKLVSIISTLMLIMLLSASAYAESSSEHAARQAKLNADRSEAKIKKLEKKAEIDRKINGVYSPEVQRDRQEIREEERRLREAQDALAAAQNE